MTNGDWIRSLNDKDLAAWLDIYDMDICESCTGNDGDDCEDKYCKGAWLTWLQSEHDQGMTHDELMQTLELLATVDTTYALKKEKAAIIDKAIKIVEGLAGV
jgi:hypothetical protein